MEQNPGTITDVPVVMSAADIEEEPDFLRVVVHPDGLRVICDEENREWKIPAMPWEDIDKVIEDRCPEADTAYAEYGMDPAVRVSDELLFGHWLEFSGYDRGIHHILTVCDDGTVWLKFERTDDAGIVHCTAGRIYPDSIVRFLIGYHECGTPDEDGRGNTVRPYTGHQVGRDWTPEDGDDSIDNFEVD